MKKIIIIFTSLLLGLTINGCSSTNSKELKPGSQLAFQGFAKFEKVDIDGNMIDKNIKNSLYYQVNMVIFSIDKNGNNNIVSKPQIWINKNNPGVIKMYDDQSDEGIKIGFKNDKDKNMDINTFIAYKTDKSQKSKHLNFNFKQPIEFGKSIEIFRYKPINWKDAKFFNANSEIIQKYLRKNKQN